MRMEEVNGVKQPGESLHPIDGQVLKALNNEDYVFRTPSGIARELGVDDAVVQESVSRLGDQVRRPLFLDDSDFITAADRVPTWRERWKRIREVVGTW